jgi:hypothetical protein
MRQHYVARRGRPRRGDSGKRLALGLVLFQFETEIQLPVLAMHLEAFPWSQAPRYLIRDRDRI